MPSLSGTPGADLLNGSFGDDTLYGLAGNDTLNGSSGNDLQEGGDGDDIFDNAQFSNFGNDTLIGGAGNDRFLLNYDNDSYAGGNGADIFVFNSVSGKDVIADFNPAEDRFDLGFWATSSSTTLHLDSNGNTVVWISSSSSSVTLKGVGQAQWSQLRDVSGSVFGVAGAPIEADDYSEDSSTTGRVAIGGSTTGRIEGSLDRDWLAVDLEAGKSYVFTLSGVDGGGGSLPDPYLKLRNSTGALLATDFDSGPGRDSLIRFAPTASGRYFLDAGGFLSSDTGTYRLAAAQFVPQPDDFPASSSTSGRVIIGASAVTAAMEQPGDNDWFAVDLEAGRIYSFALSDAGGNANTLQSSSIAVRRPTGELWGTIAGTNNSQFFAPISGRYYLSASAAFSGDGTGRYRLSGSVLPLPTADPPGIASAAPPSDGSFAQQWHLQSTAAGINVMPAWATYTGASVRVGVFDSGVDPNNRDLDTNLVYPGLNAGTNQAGGYPQTTSDNHGTAVAGVIAAERNGSGAVGVAYNARIVPIYSDLSLASVPALATALQQGYVWAIRNVDVLNDSWGLGNTFQSTPNLAFLDNFGTAPFNVVGTALGRLASEGRNGLGTVVVQSAGNADPQGDDTNLHNFQNSRYVITVGATDRNGAVASFSTSGSSILVAAPGKEILTDDRVGTYGYGPGDTASLDGTSFSAPIVSGVVALMLEANPRLGYRDVQQILAATARQTDSINGAWISNAAGTWNGGAMHYSERLGFGLVDAAAAVRLAETWPTQSTAANEAVLQGAATWNLPIPDNTSAGITGDLALTGTLTIERVEVDLNLTHSWIGDLTVTLQSPSGTLATVIARPGQGTKSSLGSNQDNVAFTFGFATFRGESAAGTWRIKAVDSYASDTGTLVSANLRTYGTSGTANDTYIYTDEFARLAPSNASRQNLADSDGGIDTINIAALSTAATIDLSGGVSRIAGQDVRITAGTIETVLGGAAADTLIAGAQAAHLVGGGGNDSLRGGGDADEIDGNVGNDTIIGGDGNDVIRGLEDRDQISGGGGDDDLNGNTGEDTVDGGDGNDIVRGGRDNDAVYGGGGDDRHVNGNIGNDVVYGGAGGDQLFGGRDNDSLFGDAGDDTLSGDLGNDVLTGGAGGDVFVLAMGGGQDQVADFSLGDGDLISISGNLPYTLLSDNGAARFELQDGSSLVLLGIVYEAFSPGWLLTA